MDEYYKDVPKDFEANLGFRKEILELTASDDRAREELWIACSRDLLFYINVFCWTYDPRKSKGVLPFITYGFQDESISSSRDCVL